VKRITKIEQNAMKLSGQAAMTVIHAPPPSNCLCSLYLTCGTLGDWRQIMEINEAGWATIDSAPRDQRIIVWGTQTGMPGSKPFSAMAEFDTGLGWVSSDPTDNLKFQLSPTHWLPLPTPPRN
jgi:hypothetical protein